MGKKSVLFVIHQLNYGGVQRAFLSALNAIDYNQYDVTVYVRNNRLELLPDINKNVGEIIANDDRRHYYRKPYSLCLLFRSNIYSFFGLKNKAEKIRYKLSEYIANQKILYEQKKFFANGKKYDVAVSYIQGYPAKLVANCIEADRKIMFYHGSTDETHILHESIFNKIDLIVGVNEGIRYVLETLYPAWKNKITYVTNYVDAEEVLKKSSYTSVSVPNNKTIICSCGRLSPVKGFDLAVEAANRLKQAGSPFLWYFVGDGPERGKLEARIREYGLENEIVITGMQPNPYPYIKACDVYVQPSYEEAHPLSIIEAQILCRPIVTTATVGGTYLVQNESNGLVTEISAPSLANGILQLVGNPDLMRRMREHLQEIDYSEDWTRYRRDWAELLGGS